MPNNPSQNGLAERMNRITVKSARSMMFHSNLPVNFWAEALNTAVYLKNRSPTTALDGIIPYECLLNRKPDVANLRVFGCVAFVHLTADQRKKFDPKSRKVILGDIQMAQRVTNCDPVSCMFLRSRDVVSWKESFMTLTVRILAHQFLIACRKIMLKWKLMMNQGSKIKLIKVI